jgi:hypothetical protein
VLALQGSCGCFVRAYPTTSEIPCGLLKYKDMLAKRWSLCGFVFHPSQSESLKRSGKIVTDKALLAASKQTVFWH